MPAHHDFRPDQVLLHSHGVGFVDFDKACMAEPALDLAAFRASMRDTWIAAMSPDRPSGGPAGVEAALARLDALCDHFLAAYLERAPVSPARVELWETLHLLTALLHGWSKVRPARLGPRLTLLLHQMRDAPVVRGAGPAGLASASPPPASM